jgi:hypothetical protein
MPAASRSVIRGLAALITTLVVSVTAASCGGSSTRGGGYEEYECPQPVGQIVREDCAQTALRYDGIEFSGSASVAGVAEGTASYKDSALRQADRLVAMLKEHRVALCNDYNTCKLTVGEYREEKARLDDSFVALAALQDRVEQMDAEGAAKLLGEIQSIRSRVAPGGASGSAGGGGGTAVVSFGGHRYQMLPGATPWHAARDACKARGAHLVTITSGEGNTFIHDAFGKSNAIWLCASDEEQEGDFRWVTGEPMGFRAYADGEPNDSGGKEDFLQTGNWESSDKGQWLRFGAQWNDMADDGAMSGQSVVQAVCEWD